MAHRQTGFTLLELVIVVLLVAVLGAIVLPKFMAMQAEARIAKMKTAAGAMKSAAALAHAMLLTKGYPADFSGNPGPAGSATDINVEGTDVAYVNGYPAAPVILALSGLAPPDFASAGGSPTSAVALPGNAQPDCQVVYHEALPGLPPTYDSSALTPANCD